MKSVSMAKRCLNLWGSNGPSWWHLAAGAAIFGVSHLCPHVGLGQTSDPHVTPTASTFVVTDQPEEKLANSVQDMVQVESTGTPAAGKSKDRPWQSNQGVVGDLRGAPNNGQFVDNDPGQPGWNPQPPSSVGGSVPQVTQGVVNEPHVPYSSVPQSSYGNSPYDSQPQNSPSLIGGPRRLASGLKTRIATRSLGAPPTAASDPVHVQADPVHVHTGPVQSHDSGEGYLSDQPYWGEEIISGEGLGNDFCGPFCPDTTYFRAEALYFTREDDGIPSLSTAFNFNDDFDRELAGRVTFGRRFDCVDGYEASFSGPFEWEQEQRAFGLPLLFFRPTNVFQNQQVQNPQNPQPGGQGPVNTGVRLSAFNGALSHFQRYETKMHTGEVSRKYFGWDVISCSLGIRYMDLEEEMNFRSVNLLGNVGTFDIATRNFLIGPQVGIELHNPMGQFASVVRLKGALFANFVEDDVLLINNGRVQINNADDDTEIAAMIEAGFYLTRKIGSNIKLWAGYDVWYVAGAALASEQITNPLFLSTGASVHHHGEVVFHGAAAGAEIGF